MGCSALVRMARQAAATSWMHACKVLPAPPCEADDEGRMNPRAVLIHAMLTPVTQILARTCSAFDSVRSCALFAGRGRGRWCRQGKGYTFA